MLDSLTGGKKLTDLFQWDAVLHDNFLFKLHHQANFTVILFGVAFIFGMNYLDGAAIKCTKVADNDNQDFNEKYCWLHGSGHVPPSLRPDSHAKGGLPCIANPAEVTDAEDERHTHYYLWVPFVLLLCLAIIKAPRVLWKEVCERGMIAGAVRGEDLTTTTQPPEKIAEKYNKLRRKAGIFHLGFFICELLNIASVLLCFAILDALFGKKYFKYGADFIAPSAVDPVDPLCNLFPSVVSCTVKTGGISGNADISNHLCLLSNNLFNQYYFLILWFWWVVLLAVSALGLVYRLAQMFLPAASQWVFLRKLEPHGVQLSDWRPGKLEKFSSADYFLLGRICQNLKGSQIVEVLKEVNKPGTSRTAEPRVVGIGRTEPRVEPEGNTEKHAMVPLTTTIDID